MKVLSCYLIAYPVQKLYIEYKLKTNIQNSLLGNPDEEERDEEDEEDEDEDDRVDDDVEDGEISAFVNHDDIDDPVMRSYERETEHLVFDIEDMIPTSVFTDGNFRLATLLPMLDTEQLSNVADVTTPSVPPAPGSVSISHPLLVRPGNGDSIGIASSSASATASILAATRTHRSQRQRLYRPTVSGAGSVAPHNWTSGPYNRHPNPPVILQRLLGPSTAQQILQLTSGAATNHPARLIFASNDFQIIAADEDWLDFTESGLANATQSSVLSTIPSAMIRWTEESHVLDGDAMHDCIASLKPQIIELWEKYRDEELAERKEEKQKKKTPRDKDDKSSDCLFNSVEPSNPKPVTEATVDASTERLAASIVEQVLGPVGCRIVGLGSNRNQASSNTSAAEIITQSNVSTSNNLELRPNSTSDGINQEQNEYDEVSQMMCAISTEVPERPLPMDVDAEDQSNSLNNTRQPEEPTFTSTDQTSATEPDDVSTPEDSSSVANRGNGSSFFRKFYKS